MSRPPGIEDSRVADVFKSYRPAARNRLMKIRQIIFDIASRTDGVGEIQETLKWGVPSYLTISPKSGTTIRLQKKAEDACVKLCVHCQTSLIATFREMYPETFEYEGNRCILIYDDANLPAEELSHFISLALTYHQRKSKNG